MQHGNENYTILQTLGTGREGTVYKIQHDGKEKVYKRLNPRGQSYIPLIQEYQRRLKGLQLRHWYTLEFIDELGFAYPYEKLKPINPLQLSQEIRVVQELYENTSIYYVDFGFGRNNIMQTENGLLKTVDYGSGFLFNDGLFDTVKDKYYTFKFRRDYYIKFLMCYVLYHKYHRTEFTKAFTTKFNSGIINTIVNDRLYKRLRAYDRFLADLIYFSDSFDAEFFSKLTTLL